MCNIYANKYACSQVGSSNLINLLKLGIYAGRKIFVYSGKTKFMDTYIKHLKINKVRNITDLNIPLSSEQRKHLIFTGKNGSGKTTLLLEIQKALSYYGSVSTEGPESYDDIMHHISQLKDFKGKSPQTAEFYDQQIEDYRAKTNHLPIIISNSGNIRESCNTGNFIMVFFDSKRQTNFIKPVSIQNLHLGQTTIFQQTAGNEFLQYIVNMKADHAFAIQANESEIVKKIDDWFVNFENQLKYIFDTETLELKFDRHTYNFNIVTEEKDIFDFHSLSDGYSAIINIISDLILKMVANNAKAYDLEGIVLIDEIETHLHIDLQKKILPFLIGFFPKIQFIVTTHSPFVLTSLSNAVICDLETKIITSDLSQYSYEAIVESYFNIDQYSEEIKRKVEKFEDLLHRKNPDAAQLKQLNSLRSYFAYSPKYLSKELHGKLLELELFELTKNDKQ